MWKLFKRAELEVRNVEVAGSKHIATVRNNAYADNPSKVTNLAIASLTTAHARVELHNLLEAVSNRVCTVIRTVVYLWQRTVNTLRKPS